MRPFDVIYEFNMNFNAYLNVLFIAANLAVDHVMADKKISMTLDVVYTFEVSSNFVDLKPLVVISPHPRFHKRLGILSYIGSRILSLGGFYSARISRKPFEEFSESTSLVPHLDVRMRRIVVSEDALKRGNIVNCDYWFTLLAALAGCHRWGFAWRRIVASALAAYAGIGYPVAEGDVGLLAASFVECAYRRVVAAIMGEERYLHPEAAGVLRSYMDHIRSVLDECKGLPGNQLLERIKTELNSFAADVVPLLVEEIEVLRELFQKAVSSRSGIGRGGGGLFRPPLLTGVYHELFPAFTRLVSRAMEAVTGPVRAPPVMVVGATETWSPIYTVFLAAKIEYEYYGRGDDHRDVRWNPPVLVVFFTPQTLPQVVFSLLCLRDPRVVQRVGVEASEEVSREEHELTRITLRAVRSGRVLAHIIPLPLPGKSVGPLYEYVYSSIEYVVGMLREKYGSEKRVKVFYEPSLTGILPLLVAMHKLEREARGFGAVVERVG